MHTKKNVSLKALASVLLCIEIKLSEHAGGINSVDSVTSESFISVKDRAFSMLP